MSDLESRSNSEEPIPYNVSDYIIPLKALRHIPTAVKQKDIFTTPIEIIYSTFVTGANLAIVYSAFEGLRRYFTS